MRLGNIHFRTKNLYENHENKMSKSFDYHITCISKMLHNLFSFICANEDH